MGSINCLSMTDALIEDGNLENSFTLSGFFDIRLDLRTNIIDGSGFSVVTADDSDGV